MSSNQAKSAIVSKLKELNEGSTRTRKKTIRQESRKTKKTEGRNTSMKSEISSSMDESASKEEVSF